MRRHVRILLYVYAGILSGVVPMHVSCQNSGTTVLEEPAKGERVCVSPPKWQVGDWFELKVSNWSGSARSAPNEGADWDEPFVRRYEIIGEESLYGYPCYVLQESWVEERGASSVKLIGDRFYFRKSDMWLIGYRRVQNWGEKRTDAGMLRLGTPPWVALDLGRNLGLVPRFPVMAGGKKLPPVWLTYEDGKPLPPRSDSETYCQRQIGRTREQKAQQETVKVTGKAVPMVRVEAEGFVSQWQPGQMWWSQCWELPAPCPGQPSLKVSTYRAALYRTSRDGLLDYPMPRAAKGGRILEGEP